MKKILSFTLLLAATSLYASEAPQNNESVKCIDDSTCAEMIKKASLQNYCANKACDNEPREVVFLLNTACDSDQGC